jgi:hypothetical protein
MHGGIAEKKGGREGFFFFVKKKQKTFVYLRAWPKSNNSNWATAPIDKSLFGSFSSEKEESSFRQRPQSPPRDRQSEAAQHQVGGARAAPRL